MTPSMPIRVPPPRSASWRAAGLPLALLVAAMAAATPVSAQEAPSSPPGMTGWQFETQPLDIKPPEGSTTVSKQRTAPDAAADGTPMVRLVALLTADGQRIDSDLIWRIFEPSTTPGTPGKLLSTHRDAAPSVRLAPGSYIVNAAFGRAHVTRNITVTAGVEKTEPFVLNAGGLRIQIAGIGRLDPGKAFFDVLSDERDQSGNRASVMSRARPNVIMRLNSGIYHVVSTYGDANATVESDVTVEAGKLTEMTITHRPARVTLKLVTRKGGEALPDTNWTLLTPDGRTVKESIGALPTHFIAPGPYLAVAKSQGNVYRREFAVKPDEVAEIEVVRD